MRPLSDSTNTEWRDSIFYEYWTDLVHSIPTMIAVRTDRYKLISYPELNDIDELYDLSKDPHEMDNLAGKAENEALHREMQEKLLKQIEASCWRATKMTRQENTWRQMLAVFLANRIRLSCE